MLTLLIAAPAFAEKRVALVIGNGAYQQAPALTNPKNDAQGMAAALKRLGFEVLAGTHLGEAGMRSLLQTFARKLDGADVALVFYAGHGLQVHGRNYLVPVDAKLEQESDLPFQAVSLDLVQGLMEQSQRTNIMILDACRDNPLARNLARSMGARSGGIGRGLGETKAGIGTLIVYATQPGNIALDGDDRYSPFTAALLKHIETPGLEIRQVLTRVRNDVITVTHDKQVPWDSSSLRGDFYFVAAPQTPPAPPKAAEPRTSAPEFEALFWQSIKDSRNAADFKAYLERYPDGVFAPLARLRIAEFERAAAEEQRRKAAEEQRADAEAKRKAEAEAKKKADEEARKKVAEEKARADAEAKKKSEEDAKKKADATKPVPDAKKQAQTAASWYVPERKRGLVAFAYRKATLERGAIAALERMVSSVEGQKDYKIAFVAGADGSEGEPGERGSLVQARLAAVRQWLSANGIATSVLHAGISAARGEGPEFRVVHLVVEIANVKAKTGDAAPKPPEANLAEKLTGLSWSGVVPPAQIGMTKGTGWALIVLFKAGGVLEMRMSSYGISERAGGPIFDTWTGTWSANSAGICVDLAKVPDGKGCYTAAVDSDGRVALAGRGFFNGKRFAR